MGHRLAATPDAQLERAARDSRFSPAAQKAARRELERRARLDGHCPRGAGCNNWNCEATHA